MDTANSRPSRMPRNRGKHRIERDRPRKVSGQAPAGYGRSPEDLLIHPAPPDRAPPDIGSARPPALLLPPGLPPPALITPPPDFAAIAPPLNALPPIALSPIASPGAERLARPSRPRNARAQSALSPTPTAAPDGSLPAAALPAASPAFPASVVIPPPLGAISTSVDFAQFLNPARPVRRRRSAAPAAGKAAETSQGEARPAPKKTAASGKRKTGAKAKPAATTRRKSAAAPKPAVIAAVPALPRRRASKARGRPVETPAVILLPDRSEELVVSAAATPGPAQSPAAALSPAPSPATLAAAREPLPRSRALAVPGTGGLLGLLARWLDASGERIDRFLARRRKARKLRAAVSDERTRSPAPPPSLPPAELDRLREENEALRRQLAALLAVRTATEPDEAAAPGREDAAQISR